MAAGDVFDYGWRRSTTGEMYVTGDPARVTGEQISTAGMAALGFFAQITPYGTLKTSGEPSTLLFDTIDGSTVDASKWTTGGTSAPTQTNGVMTFSLAASNSISSTLISKLTFPGTVGFTAIGGIVNLEVAQLTNPNCHRFYGMGQVTSYASATPVTDGMGFEVDLTGAFNCVVYVGGTRYVINSTNPALITAAGSLPSGGTAAALSAITWPGNYHRMVVYTRGDITFWFLDSLDTPIAYSSFVTPNVINLPMRVAAITTPAVSTVLATTFTIAALGVGDTSSPSQVLTPSSYQWAAPSNSTSVAYVASQVAKASPGTVYGVSGYNSKASAQFIQLHDAASLPADTAVPVNVITVPASSNFRIDFGTYGRRFSTGIVISNSSTGPTKTIGSADCFFDVQFA